jgi:hypothetical protein
VGGFLLVFKLVKLGPMHANVLCASVKRTEFVERIMALRSAALMTFVTPALPWLGAHQVGQDGASDVADGQAVRKVGAVAGGQVTGAN